MSCFSCMCQVNSKSSDISDLRVYPGTLSFLPVAEYVPKTGKSVKMLKRIRRFFLESTSRSSSMDGMSDKPFSEVFTDGKAHDSENGSDAHFSSEADTVFDRQTSRVGSSTDVPETCVTSAAVINSASASGVLPNTFQPESRQQSSNMHNSANGWDSAVNTNTSSCSETGVMHQCKRRLSGTMSRYEEVEEEVMYASKHKGQPVPTPLLPPLDQPVPDDWVVIKDKFVMFCALYQTHLGSDLLTVPSARLADGVIHLMFVREGVSRASLLRILTSFSSGAHIDLPDVEMVPVLAFRLEPEKSEGHIMVDGEQMEPEPLQCQVLPGLGRIMAIQWIQQIFQCHLWTTALAVQMSYVKLLDENFCILSWNEPLACKTQFVCSYSTPGNTWRNMWCRGSDASFPTKMTVTRAWGWVWVSATRLACGILWG